MTTKLGLTGKGKGDTKAKVDSLEKEADKLKDNIELKMNNFEKSIRELSELL